MIINDYKIFPVLIKEIEDFLNIEQIKDLNNFILLNKNLDFKSHYLFTGNSTTTYNQKKSFLDQIENNIKSCKDIKLKINELANQFSNQINGFNVKLTNSWASIQKENTSLIRHSHPDSHISGVIFLNVDEKSSPLFFFNPNPYVCHSVVKNHTEFSAEWIKITPKNGTMYLFPSWLNHGSNEIQNQTKNRIIISFNAYNIFES